MSYRNRDRGQTLSFAGFGAAISFFLIPIAGDAFFTQRIILLASHDVSKSSQNAGYQEVRQTFCRSASKNLKDKDTIKRKFFAERVQNIEDYQISNQLDQKRLCKDLNRPPTLEIGNQPGTDLNRLLESVLSDMKALEQENKPFLVAITIHDADLGTNRAVDFSQTAALIQEILERRAVLLIIGARPHLESLLQQNVPSHPCVRFSPIEVKSIEHHTNWAFQHVRDL